jgi:hypothetical protein
MALEQSDRVSFRVAARYDDQFGQGLADFEVRFLPRRSGQRHQPYRGGHVRGERFGAQHWLQASNPMERWKWNVMFQDLPPVKGHNVQMESAPQPSVIPLKLVTDEISRASE